VFEIEPDSSINIKAIGAGGAGNNIINLAVRQPVSGIEFINVNTDVQALQLSPAPLKIQLGVRTTQGEGTGGDIQGGKHSLVENREEIIQVLKGAHIIFVTAGLGGGTGTGISPSLAEIARGKIGAVTIGIVTLPFSFEGKRRKLRAMSAKEELREKVDMLISLPNDKLFSYFMGRISVSEAFEKANSVLVDIIESLSSLLVIPGIINLDMATFRKVVEGSKEVILGIGEGEGQERTTQVIDNILSSPWLETNSFKKIRRVLINVMGGDDLTFQEVRKIVGLLSQRVHPEAEITFGAVNLPKLKNKVKTVMLGTTSLSGEYWEEFKGEKEQASL